MTISLRLNDEDSNIIKAYADMNGITVSELIRRAVLEKIEDEFDLQAYNQAISEYKQNPVSYPLEDVIKELDLN
ncbi:MAG: type II toxin-antitoxin system RelB family antitoxin [Acutalibacteraceae bacterium]